MKKLLAFLLWCVALGVSGTASSIPIFEVADAGDLPGTAQVVAGTADVSTISGTIADANDVDMFRIRVTGTVPVLLQVAPSSTIDSQLFVFDTAGFAVVGNDDLGLSLDASITAPLTAGIYYLAVSSWDRDPVNAANQEIFTDLGGVLQTPINGGGPVAGYNDFGALGTYLINVRGVAPAIPEPGTIFLVLTMLAGFVLSRRRRD
jgi:hypothetical protein